MLRLIGSFAKLGKSPGSGSPTSLPTKGFIFGLPVAYVSSTSFSVGAGSATDDTGTVVMALPSALTKTTAAWAAGTGNGALDTGTMLQNTWYRLFLIQRSDSGESDLLISASDTPVMPASYNLKRRLCYLRANSTAVFIPFTQAPDDPDLFLWTSTLEDVNLTSSLGTARSLFTLTVPPNTLALLRAYIANATGFTTVTVTPTTEVNQPSDWAAVPGPSVINDSANSGGVNELEVLVDSNSQIGATASSASTTFRIFTKGWRDTRGRFN